LIAVITTKEWTIWTSDGYPLSVTGYTHADSSLDAVLLINSALGVRQEYYRPFAQFMADKGYMAITYDYRGIGRSLSGHIKDAAISMLLWGTHDLTSFLDWIGDNYPQHRIQCVGHSVGAQLIGLAHNNHKIERVLSVGGQVGYWRFWQGLDRVKSWLNFFILIPILTQIYGYFPGSILGSCDIPAGVIREWARWCRNPNFIVDADGNPIRQYFSAYRGRMLLYSFNDDTLFAPSKAVDELASYYSNASKKRCHIDPNDIGRQPIGHFGFFRTAFRQSLWEDAAAWFSAPR